MAPMGPMGIDLVKTSERCRCLRWKGLFIEVEPDPDVPHPSDGIVWCIHTMNCLGPDGKPADREDCRPGRGCFEPL